jgi:hypothetical protein
MQDPRVTHASALCRKLAAAPVLSAITPMRRPATRTPSTAKRHDAERERWSMLAHVCASLPRFAGLGGDDGALKATRETTRRPLRRVQQASPCALGVHVPPPRVAL